MNKLITRFSTLLFFICCINISTNAQVLEINYLSTYHSGVFDEGTAEIVAYEKSTRMIFVVNALDVSLDVIDISDPSSPILNKQIDMKSYGASANSVAIQNGIIAVAVENNNKQANGVVVFLDSAGNYLNNVNVGALPDMVTFSPDGNYVLCANEGEPSDDYLNDPEGSVSIIDISKGVNSATVSHATFTKFNANPPSDASIRIYGNNGVQTFAQDVEPEYITISSDSKTAFVSLQENNAIALIDIATADVTKIYGLGFKDHSIANQGIDASDKDGVINIKNWPVFGMYQPDGIASYYLNGKEYIVTANEGDARDYGAYAEEKRIKDIVLDSVAFPNYLELQDDDSLGRLTISTANGDIDNDGEFEELYCLGGRSFSIFDEDGNLVFDSGDDFEQITAMEYPTFFNATNNENNSLENRSDNKGPEPEGVTVATVGSRTFAFIGLERIGGIMAYDVTDPANPSFIQYINNRDFTQADTAEASGDMGPEGIIFIPMEDSPNGKHLIVTGSEVSGTTSIFEVDIIVGTDELKSNSNSLTAYPNPTNGNFIQFNHKISGSVFDTMGKKVLTFNNRITLNTEGLNQGIYFVRTLDGEQLKIIIQ